jgi:hypothetical protein
MNSIFLLHQESSGRRNADGMRSIRRSQFDQNILHMRFYGRLCDEEVGSNYLIRSAASYLSKYLDFSLAEIILCVMLSQFRGDFMGNISVSGID